MACEGRTGRITDVYPKGSSSVYRYTCHGEGGLFSFPVEWRYHIEILKSEGDIIGRLVEYDDGSDPPVLRFLDQ